MGFTQNCLVQIGSEAVISFSDADSLEVHAILSRTDNIVAASLTSSWRLQQIFKEETLAGPIVLPEASWIRSYSLLTVSNRTPDVAFIYSVLSLK